MPMGPGKYDPECTLARERTGARAVCLLVLAGRQGSGFSVQCTDREVLHELPELLRSMANQIAADLHTPKRA
jgi:hypothetical protein